MSDDSIFGGRSVQTVVTANAKEQQPKWGAKVGHPLDGDVYK